MLATQRPTPSSNKFGTYNFGRLWARDVELEAGVLLPIAEEKGELQQEAVVGIAECGKGMWT